MSPTGNKEGIPCWASRVLPPQREHGPGGQPKPFRTCLISAEDSDTRPAHTRSKFWDAPMMPSGCSARINCLAGATRKRPGTASWRSNQHNPTGKRLSVFEPSPHGSIGYLPQAQGKQPAAGDRPAGVELRQTLAAQRSVSASPAPPGPPEQESQNHQKGNGKRMGEPSRLADRGDLVGVRRMPFYAGLPLRRRLRRRVEPGKVPGSLAKCLRRQLRSVCVTVIHGARRSTSSPPARRFSNESRPTIFWG